MKLIPRYALLVLLFLFAQSSFASNGYFSHGYGTLYKGLAGAGVALPLSTFTVATNPAGLILVGNRYDIGLAIFSPIRQYSVAGSPSGFPGTFGLTPGAVESSTNAFVVPSLGASWMMDDRSSIGAAVYGNGGMNTNYEAKTFLISSPTGVDLAQLFLNLTYARKLSDRHAIGISAIAAYQRFKAEGLQAFANFSSKGTNLTNKDYDNSLGVGGRIGYLGELSQFLSIGASYQTRIAMGKFSEYAGLFAEQGDFDIPANWTVGAAIKPVEGLAIAVDLQRILFSSVGSVGNRLNTADFQRGVLLGSDNGAGFGWKDMTVVKFGVQYEGGGGWTWRGGFSSGKQPIEGSEVMFNILAPAVIEQHATVGFSKKVGETQSISVSVMHAFANSVSGPNPFEVPGQQTIELKMNQWEVEVGFSF